MKAVLLEPRHGQVLVDDIPPPAADARRVRIRNQYSLLSPGTERSKVQAGRQSLLGKAKERPDQARDAMRALRERGPLETYRLVSERLSTPVLLGYSAAGLAMEVPSGAHDLRPGALVAAAGGGYAAHAEVISVPANLCVPVPPAVPASSAAFSTVGAIALHAIHQSEAAPGSRVAVIGLGLVGQLAVRLLRSYGYDAVGVDRDPAVLDLARRAGARALPRDGETEDRLRRLWDGRGADAVLVCAATRSSDPVELAGSVARDRAVVVIVGEVAVAPRRAAYYGKELSIRYSRSYGPGRYDKRYEEEGAVYPEGYVPWPLRRNMEEFLRLLERGLDLDDLSPAVFPVDQAPAAYALLEADGAERRVAILLSYPPVESSPPPLEPVVQLRPPAARGRGAIRLAASGAGSFPSRLLFPHLSRLSAVELSWITSAGGVTACRQGRRWRFEEAVASLEDGLARGSADCVLVLGPHAVHAPQAAQVLRAGVGLFCEKPLGLTEEELEEVAEAWLWSGMPAMAGFNRRFAPALRDLKQAMGPAGPWQVGYRVFAGALPEGHWSGDPRQGGRLIGEACHFIDAASQLVGSVPVSVHAAGAEGKSDPASLDSFSILLEYGDGSTASVVYCGRTPAGAPKELIEVAGDGFAARVDDFRSLTTFGRQGRRLSYRRGPKGHREEMAALVALLRGDPPREVDFTASLWSSLCACRAAESVRVGRPLPVVPATPALAQALGRTVGTDARREDTTDGSVPADAVEVAR